MKKLIILFCLVNFCLVSFGQVYQEMPQYGYRANRMAFDSTLQIPTTCGVPTLKSVVSVNKKAALAFDSCNNKFYYYNPKTLVWSEVTGGGGTSPNLQQVLDSGNVADKRILLVNPYDTSLANIEINPTNFNLSNESPFINLHIGNAGVYPLETFMKLSLGDDASQTKPYLWGWNNSGAATSYFKFNSDTISFKSTGSGSGLTNLIPNGTTGNYHMPITNNAQINDTLATLQDIRTSGDLQSVLDKGQDATSRNINLFDGSANTYDATGNYEADIIGSVGKVGIRTGGELALIDASNIITTPKDISLPNHSGTLAMSVNNNYADANGNITISTGGVDSIYRTLGKDSIFYIKNGNTYAIKDSVGSGGGAGSSVSYYLNGGTAASVATYYQMSYTPVISINADFSLAGNGLISQWLTDVGNPNQLQIAAGNWNFEMYMSASSSGGTPAFYVQLLKYDGSTFTSIASSSVVPENIIGGTSIDLYLTSLAIPQTTLLATDRLAIRVYIVNSVIGRTITMHTQDSHLCQIITNFSSGISALNGLTSTTQTFATGTDSSDFKIVSSGNIHTFNLPSASASKRGALSSADWTTFNSKASGDTTSYYLISDATTSSTTAVNTNLTFAIPANGIYRIMIAGTASKAVSATGLKLSIGAPTGCTIKAVQMSGSAVASTAMTNSIITAVNTLGTTFATGIATEVPFRIEGTIINSSTAGSITLQFATVVSNVATIYAGTVMQLTKSKGL